MVLDFGAHLYPESVLPKPIEGSWLAEKLGPRLTDPQALVEFYRRSGVDGAVLSQPYYMGREDVEQVSQANDELLNIIERYEHLYGLAALPVCAGGEAAAEELKRTYRMGYHGSAIETQTGGIELTDAELLPVFEVADQMDIPILVHPKLNESLHPDALDDQFRLNAIFGREIALAESLSKVIHQGVLEQFRDLTLVYHHLGGGIASFLGRIHLQLDKDRWANQERLKSFPDFKEQIRDRVYFDSSGFFGYTSPLRETVDAFSSNHLLFGTDYPFEPRSEEEMRSFVETIRNVADESADQILSRTARSLLVNI